MPEITHDETSPAIQDAVAGFTAAIHFEGKHIPLLGPEIIHYYSSPEMAIAQGVVCIFNSGDVPVIVMAVEDYTDRVRVRAAKLTSDRVEVYHGGNLFSDLADYFLDQML